MTGTLGAILAGILLGLSLAAPPGPMNAIIAEESVLRGWDAGFRAGLGAMSADACFFVVALAGVTAVIREAEAVRAGMMAVGGLLMLYFALDAAKSTGESVVGTDRDPNSTGFRRTFALALTNPYQVLWWLTVGVTLLDPGTLAVPVLDEVHVATGSAAIVVGFFVGIGLWITAFPLVLTRADRRIDGFTPAIAATSALVLAGFGLLFLYRALFLL
ncbi:LysE family translocator [Halalkalicoccus jeotgali]|uniref:Lysine exporter protein (LYSE/YGGA) n=1 Tax=Halalkalicoccus jeotgali (strain DSM 18796 / CECT 7217 / JCM 14584 / KCTC 4019 / B3) TaxID=795797 RepID=D8J688_HALJB|nr:LysE family translocator [Halalkalicoccus jeotgali]ADJ15806.1 Lysine exporter protein (LYSE/YGGA) [Halalkalicoccus jeotgali B3]ELY37170.1 lysine exporter protein LysE/YggA [Halalkalicoccus jeotgali B3]